MKLFKNYSLSITLATFFLVAWILQGIFGWQEFVGEQEEHNQTPTIESYTPNFLRATFENWQSEFLQLFTFVVLATYLIHKDSPQSRDGSDKMQAQLARIEKLLKKNTSL